MKTYTALLGLFILFAFGNSSCTKNEDNYYRTEYIIDNQTDQVIKIYYNDLKNGSYVYPYVRDTIRYIPANEKLKLLSQFNENKQVVNTEEAVQTFKKLHIYIDDTIESTTDFLNAEEWRMEDAEAFTKKITAVITIDDF